MTTIQRACPIYVPFELFDRLRARADREGTSVNFLAMRILTQTLGAPEPLAADERDDDAPTWHRRSQ